MLKEDIDSLRENFNDETILKVDYENAVEIINYLINDGVYYAKDIFINSLDLFLMPKEEFIEKFEKLKLKLGDNYIDKLGEDFSLIEDMYL